jgi:hypothetical protein
MGHTFSKKKKDLFDDSDDPVTDVAAAFPTT